MFLKIALKGKDGLLGIKKHINGALCCERQVCIKKWAKIPATICVYKLVKAHKLLNHKITFSVLFIPDILCIVPRSKITDLLDFRRKKLA